MKKINHHLIYAFTILFIIASSANAQCPPFYTFTGEAANDFLGFSVAGGGDVNNDGYSDLIFSAYSNDAGGFDLGSVYVVSGQTGDTLYVFHGEGAIDMFGGSVSIAGDIDADGYDDIVIGAIRNDGAGTDAGRVYVFSGRTGDTLYVYSGGAESDDFGYSISSAGDVNNDGYDDIVIGARRNDGTGRNAGRAYVFSGQTGDTLYVFSGEAAGDLFGHSVALTGDLDSDGYDDVIIGAFLNDGAATDAGRAYVFSGLNGDTLYVFTGEAAGDQFGRSVSSAGDVNNDAFDDLIVGAPLNDSGGTDAGRAYVFSGQTGDIIHVFTGEAADDVFGWSVASAGDVDNDGFDDLIVGAPLNDSGGNNAGRVYVFSGQTGDTLYVFSGEAAGDIFGNSVALAGDLNSDFYDDVIIGAHDNDGGGSKAGRAYVYLLGDSDDDGIGDACCCIGIRGDVNGDGPDANILDLTYLVDFIFRGSGSPGGCPNESDVNGDGNSSDILDLTYLVDVIFRGGPVPPGC